MNVYYDPVKFGLSIVGEVEFSSGGYEFDTSVLWRDVETGDLFVADDSGCSCPVPFEGVGRGDLQRITKLQDLIDYFEKRKAESAYYDQSNTWADNTSIDASIGALIEKSRTPTS